MLPVDIVRSLSVIQVIKIHFLFSFAIYLKWSCESLWLLAREIQYILKTFPQDKRIDRTELCLRKAGAGRVHRLAARRGGDVQHPLVLLRGQENENSKVMVEFILHTREKPWDWYWIFDVACCCCFLGLLHVPVRRRDHLLPLRLLVHARRTRGCCEGQAEQKGGIWLQTHRQFVPGACRPCSLFSRRDLIGELSLSQRRKGKRKKKTKEKTIINNSWTNEQTRAVSYPVQSETHLVLLFIVSGGEGWPKWDV